MEAAAPSTDSSTSSADESTAGRGALSSGNIAALVTAIVLVLVLVAAAGAFLARWHLRKEQASLSKHVRDEVIERAEAGLPRIGVDEPRLSVSSLRLQSYREPTAIEVKESRPDLNDRSQSYNTALDAPEIGTAADSTGDDDGFVLDTDGSLRLHSVRRVNPAFVQSV